MKNSSEIVFTKTSDMNAGTLNIEIGTAKNKSLLEMRINEKTRAMNVFISDSQGDVVSLDLDSLVESLSKAKAALVKWADDAKGSEEGWE